LTGDERNGGEKRWRVGVGMEDEEGDG